MKQCAIRCLFLIALSSFEMFAQDVNNYETLPEKWALDSTSLSKEVEFRLLPYKQVYILFGNFSTFVNKNPISDNSEISEPASIAYEPLELAFQLSFKTKIIHNILGNKLGGDVWGAYTQSSRWQLYNNTLSRPFRETNYQPEVFILFGTPYHIGTLNGVFAGVGLNHESNGRSDPLSRSWNRVVFRFGWEVEKLQIILKPWIRLNEDKDKDDNPNIEDYIGRAELALNYDFGSHNFELATRHSLRDGSRNRGSARLDYSYRFYKNLKFHAQVFTGFGESLIDYNHNQTTFGVGLSLY